MEKSLLSSLAKWLRNPVIEVRLTDSDTVKALEQKIEVLQAENARLGMQYVQEVEICIRAVDKLKENGLTL